MKQDNILRLSPYTVFSFLERFGRSVFHHKSYSPKSQTGHKIQITKIQNPNKIQILTPSLFRFTTELRCCDANYKLTFFKRNSGRDEHPDAHSDSQGHGHAHRARHCQDSSPSRRDERPIS